MKESTARRETIEAPEVREERAWRLIREGFRELVRAELDGKANDTIDQEHSPLGRRRHMELCRAGKLEATKDGRRWIVTRAEMLRYLREHPHHRKRGAEDEDDDAMLDTMLGRDTSGGGKR